MTKKIRLLYAEDDAQWAICMKETLEEGERFEVVLAEDGDKTVEVFEECCPDMVLLDIEMPGKTGWELVQELKHFREWLPVVLYSSHFRSARLSEAWGLGAEDFISKDLALPEVADRLEVLYGRACEHWTNAQIFRLSPVTTFHAVGNFLTINGKKQLLPAAPGIVLGCMCRNRNAKVSKEELCERLWGCRDSSEAMKSTLRHYVSDLRKMLQKDPSIEISNGSWGSYTLKIKEWR